MFCQIAPYEGSEPFLFFSYCHEDTALAQSVLQRMAAEGCRIWYDDGIHPGDDWPEVVADHLNRSAGFIAWITPAAAASHNCRNELTLAVELRKPVVSVITEDFPLSLGTRLQLASTHRIGKFEFDGEEAFFSKLFTAQCITACMEKPLSPMAELQEPNCISEPLSNDLPSFPNQEDTPSETPCEEPAQIPTGQVDGTPDANSDNISEEAPENQPVYPSADTPEETPVRTPEAAPAAVVDIPSAEVPAYTPENGPETATIDDLQNYFNHRCDTICDSATPQAPLAVLVHPASGRFFPIRSAEIAVGRSRINCHVVFPEDNGLGRHHANIIHLGGNAYVEDKGSVNGTYVNGIRMEKEAKLPLTSPVRLQMHNVHLLYLSGEEAMQVWQNKRLILLENDTLLYPLPEEGLALRRAADAGHGCLTDPKVSRNQHAKVYLQNGQLYVADLQSRNGTYLNERRLEPNTEHAVSHGDTIRIGDTTLHVTDQQLTEGENER